MAIAFLIEAFSGKLSREQILWEIPLAEMNQLVHVHLYRQGAVCRRRGQIDSLDEKFDALCLAFAPRGLGELTSDL